MGTRIHQTLIHWPAFEQERVTRAHRFLAPIIAAFFLLISTLYCKATSNADSVDAFQQIAGLDTTQMIVFQGWNQISLPLIVSDGRVSVLFPSAISTAFAFDGSYLPQDSLRVGIGYWLKFAAAETISVNGQALLNNVVTLKKGWNLIGSLGAPIATSQVTSLPSGIVASGYFKYNSETGYTIADTLFPGQGYWVKAYQAGILKQYFDDSASPGLVSPLDSSGATIPTVFVWRMADTGPGIGYRLKVSVDSFFNTLAIDTVVTETTVTVTSLTPAQTYFWRVGQSPQRSFVIAWQDIGLGDEAVNTIAVDWSNPNVLYAGSFINFNTDHEGGVFKSTDGGTVWDTLVRGVAVDLDIHPSNPNILYLIGAINGFTPPPGVFKSTDAGATWMPVDSGLTLFPDEGTNTLAIDPLHPETLYVGTSAFGAGRLFQSTNGGSYWFEVFRGDQILSIAIDPLATNRVYIVATRGCSLYGTTDRGQTWSRIACVDTSLFSVAVHPTAEESVYVGTEDGFFLSADSGLTWTMYNTGLIEDPVMAMHSISVHPTKTNHLYANFSTSGSYANIVRSLGGGLEWEELPYSLQPFATFLGLSPDGITLYAKTTAGLYKYLLDNL